MDIKDKRIQELEQTIQILLARIAELERRLGLNSNNSSKPPSSDGLRKSSKNRSLRESDSAKFGGQLGHKGDTLRQAETPDITVEYDVEACVACGDSLANIALTSVIEKQEIDVIVQKQVTAHKALIKVCACGKRNQGIMPDRMKSPVQYSPNVRAIGTYLSNQFIAKDRIAAIFQDLFQVPISDTTLISFDNECATKLAPFNVAVLEAIKKAPVKHADESGMRVLKKTQWVHVLSTKLLTHYRIIPKRGDLLTGIVGKFVHDHWKKYFMLTKVQHVLCNAHHLRELRALIEFDQEEWAQKMYALLIEASRLISPSSEQQHQISDRFDQIIAVGLQYHVGLDPLKLNSCKKRPGHNLLLRLSNFKTETLLFLYDSTVPFTNNLAERDLRPMKLKQKVSGCFRTETGAHNFAVIRSFISTVKKQNKNIFQFLENVFNDQLDLYSLVSV